MKCARARITTQNYRLKATLSPHYLHFAMLEQIDDAKNTAPQ